MKTIVIKQKTAAGLVFLILLLVPFLHITKALAATTGTVAATVTPQLISVAVTDGAVAYGILDLSASQDTTSGGLDDTQTATNDGNISQDFNIKSTDAVGGTNWTLAGTIGADQYKHSFCTTGGGAPDPCDTTPSYTAMTTSYASLGTSISAAGTKKFDLKLDTPSSTTDFVEKSITVTVQAVAN